VSARVRAERRGERIERRLEQQQARTRSAYAAALGKPPGDVDQVFAKAMDVASS